MNKQYTEFKKSCTDEQKKILSVYAEENYNRMYEHDAQYRLCLDGNYSLDDLRIFVKILESKEYSVWLEQFDNDFGPPVYDDYEEDK